jgi:hypothetical protein
MLAAGLFGLLWFGGFVGAQHDGEPASCSQSCNGLPVFLSIVLTLISMAALGSILFGRARPGERVFALSDSRVLQARMTDRKQFSASAERLPSGQLQVFRERGLVTILVEIAGAKGEDGEPVMFELDGLAPADAEAALTLLKTSTKAAP